MSNSIRPSGHNKQYYAEEEALLISLKGQGLSWPQVVAQFNAAVALDRQRNVAGLSNKWRQLNCPQSTIAAPVDASSVPSRYD